AKIVCTDIEPQRVKRVVDECGATAVAPSDIYGVPADVFAPCALGAVINDDTIRRLEVEIVAGGANNQLAEDRHGDLLEARHITYAPDYVINGGGLINVNAELHDWSPERARNKAGEIYDTILRVFEIARDEGIPSYRAAVAWSPEIAELARKNNDANVLVLPSRFVSEEEGMEILHRWLDTGFEGGRHARRAAKIDHDGP